MTKITAWSFSRWSAYEECPFKAKCKFVDKLQEPQNEAMARGESIHKQAEQYVVNGGRLPPSLKKMAADFKAIRKLGAVAEGELAFTRTWQPTGWFDRDAWCRVKVDAIVPPLVDADAPVVRVIDHKTGKLREAGEYDAQLEIYGLAGLLRYPTAREATGEIWFIDHGTTLQRPEGVFPRKDERALKKLWEGRVKKMLSDTRFEPRPGNYCRWCHFRRANGGPCKY